MASEDTAVGRHRLGVAPLGHRYAVALGLAC